MKKSIPYKFWEKYYNSDILERDKIITKIMSKHMISAVDALKNIKPSVRERAVTITLMGYFDDLIEFMDTKNK